MYHSFLIRKRRISRSAGFARNTVWTVVSPISSTLPVSSRTNPFAARTYFLCDAIFFSRLVGHPVVVEDTQLSVSVLRCRVRVSETCRNYRIWSILPAKYAVRNKQTRVTRKNASRLHTERTILLMDLRFCWIQVWRWFCWTVKIILLRS